MYVESSICDADDKDEEEAFTNSCGILGALVTPSDDFDPWAPQDEAPRSQSSSRATTPAVIAPLPVPSQAPTTGPRIFAGSQKVLPTNSSFVATAGPAYVAEPESQVQRVASGSSLSAARSTTPVVVSSGPVVVATMPTSGPMVSPVHSTAAPQYQHAATPMIGPQHLPQLVPVQPESSKLKTVR